MIFKRKESKPPKEGDFCYLKDSIVQKMIEEGFNDKFKGAAPKYSFKMSNAKMIYINRESVYSSLYFEVVVLQIQEAFSFVWKKVNDNYDKKKTFLIRKDSLEIMSQSQINTCLSDTPIYIKRKIERNMESNYNVSDFSWEIK
jgi:hypothetical protein